MRPAPRVTPPNLCLRLRRTPTLWSARLSRQQENRRALWMRGNATSCPLLPQPVIIDKVDEVLRRPHLLGTYPFDENDIQQMRHLLEEEAIVPPPRPRS